MLLQNPLPYRKSSTQVKSLQPMCHEWIHLKEINKKVLNPQFWLKSQLMCVLKRKYTDGFMIHNIHLHGKMNDQSHTTGAQLSIWNSVRDDALLSENTLVSPWRATQRALWMDYTGYVSWNKKLHLGTQEQVATFLILFSWQRVKASDLFQKQQKFLGEKVRL